MSENNGRNLDPDEAASLAADDSRRAELARSVSDPVQRAALEKQWAEADRVRQTLAAVDMPAGLEARLLAIPDATEALDGGMKGDAGRRPGSARRKTAWLAVAAAVVIGALLAGAWLWHPWKEKPVPLMASLRTSIAIWAVKSSNKPLDIASADAGTVQKKLESYATDFPVMMLAPSGNVALEGGGSCDFGPAKAVFTRWAGDGYTCTLYEFNGQDIGAPPLFNTAPETPTELWRNDLHYRVIIFPGAKGKCCWALVMDTDKAVNNFAKYSAGTY